MHPLVWLSRHVTGLVSGGRGEQRMSEDELLVMIRLSGQTGILREDEVQAMTNILALKTKKVREVMTPRVVVFSRSCELTVGDLRDEAGTWTHGRVPVYDQDEEDIVGIVHRRNVLAAIGRDNFDIKLSELMIPAHFVQQSYPLDRLLRLFLEKRMQMVVVLGEYGDLAGIVTLEDVLESLLGKEIVDEFDKVENMRELAHRRRDELLRGRRRSRRKERGPEPPR
jgi:CBS domain containing-hemolysin-like protein